MNFEQAVDLAAKVCELAQDVGTPTAAHVEGASFNVAIQANVEISPGVRRECVVHVTQSPSMMGAMQETPWLEVFKLAEGRTVEPFDRGLTIR